MNPGLAGLEDCESLFAHLETKKMITEKYPGRYFLITEQAAEEGDLDNAHWLPGSGNPADGSTKGRSDMAPFLRLLESGRFRPGSLRPLKGVAWEE